MGESIIWYPHKKVGTSETIKAIVQTVQATEVAIESDYSSKDYIRIYVLSDIDQQDKITHQSMKYKVETIQDSRFEKQLIYRTAICKRVIENEHNRLEWKPKTPDTKQTFLVTNKQF